MCSSDLPNPNPHQILLGELGAWSANQYLGCLLTFLAAFSYSAVKQMQNRKPPAGPVVPKGDDVAMQARQKLAEANPDLKPNFNQNLNSDPTPNLKPNPNPNPNAGAAEAGGGGRGQRGRVQVRQVSGRCHR